MSLTRSLSDSTVVVTGASSGIGAATAVALARHGTNVVLAARNDDALRAVAERCRMLGAEALAVPTDVTDPDAMEHLADRAVGEFGRIDAWVNNAGVATVGPFEQLPLAEIRRVVEVDLFGVVHGMRAALPRLRAAGGGVVVNNASILAEISMPYQSAYNAAKHAVRGISNTVRQELRHSGDRGISICTVLPATIDTPFFRHGANHSGRLLAPPPPVYRPELVARTIAGLLRRPRREAYAGGAARLAGLQWRLAPGLSERVLGWYGSWSQFSPTPTAVSSGNLFQTDSAAQPAGGWRTRRWPIRRAGAVLALIAAGTVAGTVTARLRHVSNIHR